MIENSFVIYLLNLNIVLMFYSKTDFVDLEVVYLTTT